MKKLISMILVLGTILSMMAVPASAASRVRPSDEFIQGRIEELCDWLEGEYFNIGQNTDCGKKSKGHGCSKCSTKKIIQQDWFQEHFDTKIELSQFGTGNASSCVGFGWFAGWYIMRASDSDSVTRVKVGEYSSNIKKNMMNKALVGDYLWMNGNHAVIYLGCNDKGIQVLDCNAGNSTKKGAYNCLVQKRTIPFKNINTVRIHRFYSDSGNYCQHEKFETLKKSDGTYAAFCKACGDEYRLGQLDTSTAGVYKTTKNANTCTQPYKDSGIMCTKKGTKLTIVGSIVNAYGNLWMQTESGHWIYSENLKKA